MSTEPLAEPPREGAGVEAVLSALSGAGEIDLRETHISYVFLAGDSAYKLKKRVTLPFLDYGSLERRRVLCHEEVRLNRRLAPSIYRGVLAVVPRAGGFRLAHADDPNAVEHVVWMRRFDESRTFAACLDRGPVEAIAACLAEFHDAAPPAGDVDPVEQTRAVAAETFASLTELAAPALRPMVTQARRFTESFLHEYGAEMRARARAGRVVDGHGDLRAEHILLNGTVEIVDCIEFDPSLRRIDAGADLAFLLMDLERLAAPESAHALLRAYSAYGGDPGDPAHIAFHAAQRAWVRAKVALLRGDEGEARELLALGGRLRWRARQPLLLVVCGLSATGKTTVARELGAVSGAPVLSSDVVRKQLAGVEPDQHAAPEYYSPEFSRRTYATLGRLADAALRDGGLAIVDATFRHSDDRTAFSAALGWRFGPETLAIECVVPDALRARRAATRPPAESDATAEIAHWQSFDQLTEIDSRRHLRIHTDRPLANIAEAVESWLDASSARQTKGALP